MLMVRVGLERVFNVLLLLSCFLRCGIDELAIVHSNVVNSLLA